MFVLMPFFECMCVALHFFLYSLVVRFSIHNMLSMFFVCQTLETINEKEIRWLNTLCNICVTFGTNLLKRNYSFTCIIETNEIVTKMSFLNYHDCPWRATTDLVRGRVSSRVPAWLLALPRYAFIIRCWL